MLAADVDNIRDQFKKFNLEPFIKYVRENRGVSI